MFLLTGCCGLLGRLHSFGLFAIRALALACNMITKIISSVEEIEDSHGGMKCVYVQTSIVSSLEDKARLEARHHFEHTQPINRPALRTRSPWRAMYSRWPACVLVRVSVSEPSAQMLTRTHTRERGGCHFYSITLSLAGAPAQWECFFSQVAASACFTHTLQDHITWYTCSPCVT